MIIRTVSPSKISVDAAAAGVTDSVVVVVVVTRGIPKYSAKKKMVGRLIITCEHTQQLLIQVKIHYRDESRVQREWCTLLPSVHFFPFYAVGAPCEILDPPLYYSNNQILHCRS